MFQRSLKIFVSEPTAPPPPVTFCRYPLNDHSLPLPRCHRKTCLDVHKNYQLSPSSIVRKLRFNPSVLRIPYLWWFYSKFCSSSHHLCSWGPNMAKSSSINFQLMFHTHPFPFLQSTSFNNNYSLQLIRVSLNSIHHQLCHFNFALNVQTYNFPLVTKINILYKDHSADITCSVILCHCLCGLLSNIFLSP